MPSARYLLLIPVFAITTSAEADSRFLASLSKLDPQTRLEQVCDLAAVNHIGKSEKLSKPDRAKANVITPPRLHGDTIEGTGGAFRSGGKWYAFSFTCKGSPDHLTVPLHLSHGRDDSKIEVARIRAVGLSRVE